MCRHESLAAFPGRKACHRLPENNPAPRRPNTASEHDIHRPGIAGQGARAERRPNTAAHSCRASQSQDTKPRDDQTQRAYIHATGHRRARLSVDSSTPFRHSQPAFIRNSLRAGPDMGGKSTDERQHGRGTQGAHTLHGGSPALHWLCCYKPASKPEQQSHVSTRLLIYPAEGVRVLAAEHTHGSGWAVQKSRCSGQGGFTELLTAASMLTQLGAIQHTQGWRRRGVRVDCHVLG